MSINRNKLNASLIVDSFPKEGEAIVMINLNHVEKIRLSGDRLHAEVLLKDGEWVRIAHEYELLRDKIGKLPSFQ